MSNWEERRFEEIVEVNPITKLKKGNEYKSVIQRRAGNEGMKGGAE